MPEPVTLELRLLGEMEVIRGGERVELPPSKKTRALLAYLVLTGKPHRRDRLCQLLWDVADDPRGALRWSLSRLRPLVDASDQTRIQAARDKVAFEARGAWIDVSVLKQRCEAGLDDAPLEELTALARQFRGELLEGLGLDDFLDFQAWCVAEREGVRMLQATLLRSLVTRLAGDPPSALPYAQALAVVDPLDETARAQLVGLLAATGRRREAEQQVEAARRLLRELGRPASGPLEAAWRSTQPARQPASPPPGREREAESSPPPVTRAGLVGRDAEIHRLLAALDQATRDRRARALLITGEPGLGKSRLIEEVGHAARTRGGTVLEGRAFEAEAGRPFGPWIDALRQLPEHAMSAALRPDLTAILPELSGERGAPPSRDRLFGAVVDLLAECAAGAPPLALVLDDVHWIDAASAELLHFVARMSRSRPLLIVLAARAGELLDNEPAQRTLRSLRELGLLAEVPLLPLDRAATAALVLAAGFGASPVAAASGVGVEDVFSTSGGNPLFALEVARSAASAEGRLPGSLAELIRHRVERLPPEAGDVLRWAAVLGRRIDAEGLGELMALDVHRLLGALDLLERHALLRAGSGADGRGAYEFAHEVVHRAIYTELSQPRRRLMHLRIAERLGKLAPAETTAADLAYHAALAGENVLATSACVRAGRLFLRQFANGEAWAMARRGRRHAAEVPEPQRTSLLLELLQVELQARRAADVGSAARELETLAERALDHGDAEHARLGFHMLAYLRWEGGDLGDAQRQMLRAERVGRTGDELDQIRALAESARCLVLLEHDLPRAEALALEASARSSRAGPRPSAIADSQGLLRQHQGRLDEAQELFEQARLEARGAADAMDEFRALEHLVVLRQEQGDWTGSRRLAEDLVTLGGKLREGSEAPFASALLSLCRVSLGETEAADALDAAIAELRVVDAKLRLAYSLTRAARIDLERGDAVRARARAEEARQAGMALGRPTETLLASLTLARACGLLGEDLEVSRIVDELRGPWTAGAAELARHELDGFLRERDSLGPLAGSLSG